jgi:transposase
MSRTRRVFGKDFKAKVVLEASREKETLEVLAKKYVLLPMQISMWKAEAIKNISAVFNQEYEKKRRNSNRKVFCKNWTTDFRE